jgi:hypothetical protein
MVIRNGSEIIFDELGADIKSKYATDYQELFNIYKVRNKFFIEGVQPIDRNQDIDDKYLEAGEPTLSPIEMRERMYNVVRFQKIISTKRKQDYLLKKNDIIKMGRVKIKVNQIHIKQRLKDREIRTKRHQERVKMEIEKKLKEFEGIGKNKNHKIFRLGN